MKRILVILFLWHVTVLESQSPSWLWAKRAGSTGSEAGYAITTDAAGNVYVTGNFAGTSIVFGTFTLTNTNSSTRDLYVVKYDPQGNVVWATSAGGTGDEYTGNSIAIDQTGNVFITGWFTSPVIATSASTLTNSGEDLFILKYSGNGSLLWAKSEGGIGDDRANGIAVDAAGSVYIIGSFNSQSITIGSFTLYNSGFLDCLVAKYSAAGTSIWAGSGGSADNDSGMSLQIDQNGDILATGYFTGSVFSVGTFNLSNQTPGYSDILLAKIDPNGTILWAQSFGSTSYDTPWNLAVDATGNSYITGWTRSPTLALGSQTLVGKGLNDILVLKCDGSGNPVWANSIGGTGYDEGNGIDIDPAGNVYVSGFFESATVIAGNYTLSNVNSYGQMVVAKFNSNGTVAWAKGAGSTSYENGWSVATNSIGEVYVSGWFASNQFQLGTTTLNNAGATGSTDMFVAKLAACAGPSISATASPSQICVGESSTLSATGASNYAWPGVLANTPSIIVSPTANATYTVSGSDNPACPTTVSIALVVNACLSIGDEAHLGLSVTVFPNPGKGRININSTRAIGLRIVDLLGKEHYSTSLEEGSNAINSGFLPAGVYILEYENNSVGGSLLYIKEE